MTIKTVQFDLASMLGDERLKVTKVTLEASATAAVKVRIECVATKKGATDVGEMIASSEYALPDKDGASS